jgi:hypothetical protein
VTTAHEPRRGPGVHPSTEDLSALAEGAEPAAEGLAAHLQDCAACRAEVDAISELLTAFAELDAPALPEDVAIRIDAALARESMVRAAETDLAGDARRLKTAKGDKAAVSMAGVAVRDSAASESEPSSSRVSDARSAGERPQSSPRGSRRARWRGLGWAMASLVLLAGGLTLAVDLTSSSTGSSSSTASGSSALSPGQKSSGGPMAERQLAAPGTMLAAAPLAMWVKEILPTRTGSTLDAGPAVGTEAGALCVANPKFSGYKRLATANGTYEGTPATLVIYANGSDASSVYAVAYAKPCTASSYPLLAEGVVSY